MRLRMLLLPPYRTVVHDFFLDIPVFCLHSPGVFTLTGAYAPTGVCTPTRVHALTRFIYDGDDSLC